jgi:hypothetical protein
MNPKRAAAWIEAPSSGYSNRPPGALACLLVSGIRIA